jgi:nucleotide-binding universal stress UspA family protein
MQANGIKRPTVLVTLDGSHFSEAILGTVMSLAPALGADVELFRVGNPHDARDTPLRAEYGELAPMATSTGTRVSVPLPSEQSALRVETREQAIDRIDANMREYLSKRAAELPGINTTIAVDIADDPAQAIIAHARRVRPDLIAMATHGRSGISQLLTGSVCESVIRSGVAPVIVIRP